MNYNENDEKNFICKLLNETKIDKEKLIYDIKEYKKFELIRRNILHGNIKNHYH